MNVYILVEEIDQSEYLNHNEPADPISNILGIYQDRNKAEYEKNMLDKTREKFCSYFVEERPLL